MTEELFRLLHADPQLLPDDWRARAGEGGHGAGGATMVGDYVAGMTDRYALDEHRRLTDPNIPGNAARQPCHGGAARLALNDPP